jgi:hypothetical protein
MWGFSLSGYDVFHLIFCMPWYSVVSLVTRALHEVAPSGLPTQIKSLEINKQSSPVTVLFLFPRDRVADFPFLVQDSSELGEPSSDRQTDRQREREREREIYY